jgi:hypothetical protein
MGIQMMGGNPLESFQTGYNLGNKPNAVGTAILGVMDRYEKKRLLDQELGNKLKLSQWESQNITGPAETAKFERQKTWDKEKIELEHKNKLEQIIEENNAKAKAKSIEEKQKPLSGDAALKYSGALQGMRDIKYISDELGLNSGTLNPNAKELIYKSNLAVEGANAKATLIPGLQGVYKGVKYSRAGDAGSRLSNKFMTLAENLLRARTGAAAPDPEIVREYARSLLRGYTESPETWISKLKQNEEFLSGVAKGIRPEDWESDLDNYSSKTFGSEEDSGYNDYRKTIGQ